jgi:hypothetical protein
MELNSRRIVNNPETTEGNGGTTEILSSKNIRAIDNFQRMKINLIV